MMTMGLEAEASRCKGVAVKNVVLVLVTLLGTAWVLEI